MAQLNHFPKNLLFLRKRFKVTQAGLAAELDKVQTTIGNWESGDYKPTIEDLIRIAQYFAISLDTLVFVEIERSNLIQDKDLTVFRERNKLGVNRNNKLKSDLNGLNRDPALNDEVKEDTDSLSFWVLLEQLKKMDEKLDLLRVSMERLRPKK